MLRRFFLKCLLRLIICGFASNNLIANESDVPAHKEVVKIISFECDKPRGRHTERRGNGILVTIEGVLYVWTAAHAPHPAPHKGNGPNIFCYEAQKDQDTSVRLSFVAAHFLKDMALLRVADNPPASIKDSALDIAKIDKKRLAVVPTELLDIVGYSFSNEADGTPDVFVGQVSDPKNNRKDRDFKDAIAMRESNSTAGQSGGACYKRDGTLVGLTITRKEYFQLDGTLKQQPDPRKRPTQDVITVANSVESMVAWTYEVLAGAPLADLRLDARSDGGISLTMEDFTFTVNHCPEDGIIAGQGHGIAGQGHGIAGTNDERVSQILATGQVNVFEVCQVIVSRAYMRSPQKWPFAERRALERLQKGFAAFEEAAREQDPNAHIALYISYVFKESWGFIGDTWQVTDQTESIPIKSLNHLLRLMKDGFFPNLSNKRPAAFHGLIRTAEEAFALYEGKKKEVARNVEREAELLEIIESKNEETLRFFWNKTGASEKHLIFEAVFHHQKGGEKSLLMLGLALTDAISTKAEFEIEASRHRAESYLDSLEEEGGRIWLDKGNEIITQIWTKASPKERASLYKELVVKEWDKEKVIAYREGYSALLLYSLLQQFDLFGGDPDHLIQDELIGMMRPEMKTIFDPWVEAVKAGTAEKMWGKTDIMKRLEFFTLLPDWEEDEYPALVRKGMKEICPGRIHISLNLPSEKPKAAEPMSTASQKETESSQGDE